MTNFRHFPLGAPYPDSPHAVVSSLPTMDDVIGYEERDPRVISAMGSGYPRFVVHAFVAQLIEFYSEREALAGRVAVLIPSGRAVRDLVEHVGAGVATQEVEPSLYIAHVNGADGELVRRLNKYVQHVGCGISSRQAEDLLLEHGLLQACFPEASSSGAVEGVVLGQLAEQIGCREKDVLLCASGMNAFYAGYRAVQEFQRGRGRQRWLQLGWLYLDSGVILQEFAGDGESLELCYDVLDVDVILEKIRAYGDELAAVVVECPSNPLIRVCELERIAVAVREQGGVMIVDPTIASVFNVDVLPCSDILVTSLTKYAAIEGDVMIGALAVNPDSPFYGDLILRTASFHVAPYRRDLSRFAVELAEAPELVRTMNANAAKLCQFLKKQESVEHIYCAGCSEHIAGVAKGEAPVGAVISIELKGSMQKFYDAVKLMKGPSFGTRYTLLCPFLYLAHYDLVSEPSGRAFLSSVGLDPDLIRISVGAEPYEAIEAVIAEALEQSFPAT
jgi:cystathionine gamma-synthase